MSLKTDSQYFLKRLNILITLMAATDFEKLFEEQECNICLNKHSIFLKNFCACNSRICVFCAITVTDTPQASDN